MRDLIWTIIVIWLVWKIYTLFASVKTQSKASSNHTKEGEIKVYTNYNTRAHFNPKDAEYVDFEEIK
ncbi:MAG: hypothetical protein U0W65_14250 [Bacteroidia bacterium]